VSRVVGIQAVNEVNEAVDRRVVSDTLAALQSSAASLANVADGNAVHYQQLLARVKSEKAQVESHVSLTLVVQQRSASLSVPLVLHLTQRWAIGLGFVEKLDSNIRPWKYSNTYEYFTQLAFVIE